MLMNESRDLLAKRRRSWATTLRECSVLQNLGLDVLRYSIPLLDNPRDQTANDHFVLRVLEGNDFYRFWHGGGRP